MSEEAVRQRFVEAVGRGMYERDHASRGLGIELENIRPGYACMRMTVREDMLNSRGTCQGGMIFSLADSAFAYACNARNEATVALSCFINFASAAHVGEELTAVAEERLRQSRTGIYDITVTGADGRVVAVFRGNSYRVKGEAVPGLNAGADEQAG